MSGRGIVCLSALALAGCGGASSGASTTAMRTHPATVITPTATVPSQTSPVHHPHPHHQAPRPKGPPPGSLPQTPARPSSSAATFHRKMSELWRGIERNSVSTALPAFFPLRAYLQIKAIADARGDWTNRLVEDFRLDIGAAHALLGAEASSARLVEVSVPDSYAHWVPPGACYNTVGYWEVPNARVVYRDSTGVHSFGIASMISWRGRWFVVHLGAVLRSGAVGVVDSPSSGVGVSAYSGTC